MTEPEPPRLVTRTIDTLVRQPKGALIALTLISLSAGWWGAQIPIKGDMEALLPPDTPSIIHAQDTRAMLGERSELTCIIGGDSREANLSAAAFIARELEGLSDFIQRVEFKRDVATLEANALLFLERDALMDLKARVEATIAQAVEAEMAIDDFDTDADEGKETEERLPTKEALFKRYNLNALRTYQENAEGTVVALSAYPKFKPQDVTRSRALMAKVDAIVAKACADDALSCVVEGDYTGLSRSVNQLSAALQTSSLIALIGVILLLSLAFRRAIAVLLIVVPLAMALAWTLGLTHLVIGELNLISAFIFAILIGLGIDFGVHALSRVDEEVAQGHGLAEALKRGLSALGPAMRVAAGTTMATFLSLTWFDFRGFSHFGAIATLGIALSLLAIYLVLPPLALSLRRRSVPQMRQHNAPGRDPLMPLTLAWASLLFICLVALWSFSNLGDLRFEGDMRTMRLEAPPEDSSLKRAYREEVVGRAPSPAVLITGGGEETERVTRHLEALATTEARLSQVASIYSFIPSDQDEKLALIAEIRRRVTQKLGLLQGQDRTDAERLLPFLSPKGLSVDTLPPWIKARFEDADRSVDRVIYLFAEGIKSRAEEVLEIEEAIGQVEVSGVRYRTTAPWMFTGEAYATVKDEGPIAIALAAFVVLLLLLIDLRSISAALRAYMPLLAGILISLGLISALGFSLNLFNIVVLPVMFGIGVDTAVHLTHRRREGATVSVMLCKSGKAAALSALTTAVGFASLLSVPSEGLRSIGWVALIGVVVTTATTMLGITALESLRRHTP